MMSIELSSAEFSQDNKPHCIFQGETGAQKSGRMTYTRSLA